MMYQAYTDSGGFIRSTSSFKETRHKFKLPEFPATRQLVEQVLRSRYFLEQEESFVPFPFPY